MGAIWSWVDSSRVRKPDSFSGTANFSVWRKEFCSFSVLELIFGFELCFWVFLSFFEVFLINFLFQGLKCINHNNVSFSGESFVFFLNQIVLPSKGLSSSSKLPPNLSCNCLNKCNAFIDKPLFPSLFFSFKLSEKLLLLAIKLTSNLRYS